ncbi:maleylpyruvate isomerase family mycothiol-dependent enzyme [Intrasporangium mesophilum]
MDQTTTAKDAAPDSADQLERPGPIDLTLDDLGDGLGSAATVLRANAAAAGLDAPVPTCPEWTVRDLVAHQGMVHRWATSHLAGRPVDDTSALERQGRESPDLLGWFDTGATALLQTIVDAPDDVEAFVFLKDAPAPRIFWTRRQCHETTVHAVDALAARLGRPPEARETWIRPSVALDGIDELLVGFVTRKREGINPGHASRLLVRPSGSDVGWLVDMAPGRSVHTRRVRLDGTPVDSDAEITGTPVEVYLSLWSRSPVPPANDVERWWRDTVSISW